MIVSSKVLISSYFHAKTTMNSFKNSSYLALYFADMNFDNLTYLVFAIVPRLQSITSASFSRSRSFKEHHYDQKFFRGVQGLLEYG
jgi:hypothetical protein